MARLPSEGGLVYFPVKVNMGSDSNDRRLEYLELRFKDHLKSFFVSLLQNIYEVGYFVQWTERNTHLYALKYALDQKLVQDMLDALVTEKIFIPEIYQQYQVLTSRATQKNFLEAVVRRKKITLISEYWVLDIPPKMLESKQVVMQSLLLQESAECEQESPNGEVQGIPADIMQQDVNINPINAALCEQESTSNSIPADTLPQDVDKGTQSKRESNSKSNSKSNTIPPHTTSTPIEFAKLDRFLIPRLVARVEEVPDDGDRNENDYHTICLPYIRGQKPGIPSQFFSLWLTLWRKHGSVRLLWAFMRFIDGGHKKWSLIEDALEGRFSWDYQREGYRGGSRVNSRDIADDLNGKPPVEKPASAPGIGARALEIGTARPDLIRDLKARIKPGIAPANAANEEEVAG